MVFMEESLLPMIGKTVYTVAYPHRATHTIKMSRRQERLPANDIHFLFPRCVEPSLFGLRYGASLHES